MSYIQLLFDKANQAIRKNDNLLPATNTLLGYLKLEEDWDGYGAEKIKRKAIKNAIEFLEKIPLTVRVPTPMVAGSGNVGLYWENKIHYCSVEFNETNGVAFFTESTEQWLKGYFNIHDPELDQELTRFIETYFKFN